jgi:heat shock protein HtpX
MTSNTIKTVLLLGLLSGLFVLCGQAFAGRYGLYYGLGGAVIMNFISYFFSDKIALRMYSAQPVTESENAAIYLRVRPIVENLTQRMALPMPKLWLIPDDSPNAFATGRDPQHASVAVTRGILSLMDDRELAAVLAHELGHVLHRDILISSIAATMAGALTGAARMAFWFSSGGRRSRDSRDGGAGALIMLIVAPIAAMLIQLWISRTREFSADEAAAKYTGTPHNMVSALQKLEAGSQRIPLNASPSTAHMFIIQPFSSRVAANWFSTHPSTADRVARLQAMR